MSGIDEGRIKKYFKNSFSVTEDRYLSELFSDNANSSELKSIVINQLESADTETAENKKLDHILHQIHYRINSSLKRPKEQPLRRMIRWYAQIAAILMIPLLIYLGWLMKQVPVSTPSEGWCEIAAPMGARINFLLPDGTIGCLNKGSVIRYPLNFSLKREIKLMGQAFFDVKHDEKNKFVVKTKYLDVEVKGTCFDVAAYEDESETGVTLLRGSVLLTGAQFSAPVEMKPNEQVIYHSSNNMIEKSEVSTSNYVAWKEGKLMLRNASPDELARQLSRWYNVDVQIPGGKEADILFRATFEDENLEEVLRLLKLSFPLDYRIVERMKQPDGSFSKRKIILKINQPN